MSSVDCWVYFDGPEPASLRPFLDALRDDAAPSPSAAQKASAFAEFVATFDARRARIEQEAEEDDAEEEAGAEEAGAGDAAGEVAEEEPTVAFGEWAELSVRFLGKGEEELQGALTARGVTAAQWAQSDARHLAGLGDEGAAGSAERRAIYAAKCDEERARRAAQHGSGGASSGDDDAAVDVCAATRPVATLAVGRPAVASSPSVVMGSARPEPESRPAYLPAPPAPPMASTALSASSAPIASTALSASSAPAPCQGQEVVASGATFPTLTVEQYASLLEDLAAFREPRPTTLLRYGVPNNASLMALHAHWRGVGSAEIGAALVAARERYRSWLRSLDR